MEDVGRQILESFRFLIAPDSKIKHQMVVAVFVAYHLISLREKLLTDFWELKLAELL